MKYIYSLIIVMLLIGCNSNTRLDSYYLGQKVQGLNFYKNCVGEIIDKNRYKEKYITWSCLTASHQVYNFTQWTMDEDFTSFNE